MSDELAIRICDALTYSLGKVFVTVGKYALLVHYPVDVCVFRIVAKLR